MLDLRRVVHRLLKHYRLDEEIASFVRFVRSLSSFELLTLVVLSQNTSDVLALRALRNLTSALGRPITPEKVVSANDEVIVNAIRVSGMYNRKLRTIKCLAERLLRDGLHLRLDELDVQSVRNVLLSVPGVGPKTVDVYLLMHCGYPTFPIDTHIRRVLVRLGVVERGWSYDEMKRVIESLVGRNADELVRAHLTLIHHGRTLCKSRRPRCSACPVSSECREHLSRARHIG